MINNQQTDQRCQSKPHRWTGTCSPPGWFTLTAAVASVDRRGFLIGVIVAFSGLPLQMQAASETPVIIEKGQPKRALFQQLPYFDFEGSGENYSPPQGNQATRDYLASISHEEFLRRHWFS